MKKALIYLLSLIALTSCMPYGYFAKYDVKLSSIEFPVDAKVQYGQYKTLHCESGHTYKDSNIAISWIYKGDFLFFTLDNKTQHTINIHWNKATFVDITGVVQPVVHNTPHALSSIPRHATLNDVIMRNDKESLFPVYYETTEELRALANKYKGYNFWVTLPIEIEGVINEYTFVFLIGEQYDIPEAPQYVDYSERW